MIFFFKEPIIWNLNNPFSGNKDSHNDKRNIQANLPLNKKISKNKIPIIIKKN